MNRVVTKIINIAKKTPYHHLGDYMDRFVLRDPGEDQARWGARVHNVKRSDYDRCLHDHPWWNISIVLRDGYWEIFPGTFQSAVEADFVGFDASMERLRDLIAALPGKMVSRADRQLLKLAGVHWRGAGAIVRRKALTAHRLVIPAGSSAWSIFIMGKREKDWGFHATEGWVHADVYRARIGREI